MASLLAQTEFVALDSGFDAHAATNAQTSGISVYFSIFFKFGFLLENFIYYFEFSHICEDAGKKTAKSKRSTILGIILIVFA